MRRRKCSCDGMAAMAMTLAMAVAMTVGVISSGSVGGETKVDDDARCGQMRFGGGRAGQEDARLNLN